MKNYDFQSGKEYSSATPTKPEESTARVPLLLDSTASPPPAPPSTTLMPSNVCQMLSKPEFNPILASGIVWDDAALDQWLTNPKKFVPGKQKS